MIAIIQRVKRAKVSVEDKVCGECGDGFMVLLGILQGDTEDEAEILAAKISNLRIICDENEKMNLSLLDTKGEVLVISNFTLSADTKKGNRPSFIAAAAPDEAERLYELFCEKLRKNGVSRVETGEFGADMQIDMTADGPVTITLNTDTWKRSK